MDVLEQGLPDGVLQGACVLGGWEVFVGQIGLMDFPFESGRRAREQATLGAGFLSQHLREAGIGRGHVWEVCWTQAPTQVPACATS